MCSAKGLPVRMDSYFQTSQSLRFSAFDATSRTLQQPLLDPGCREFGRKFFLKWRKSHDCLTSAQALSWPRSTFVETDFSHARCRSSLVSVSYPFCWQLRTFDSVLRRREKRKRIRILSNGPSSRSPFITAADNARISVVQGVLDSRSSDSNIVRSVTREEHAELWEKLYDERGAIFSDEVWGTEELNQGQGDGENVVRLPEGLEEKWTAVLEAGQLSEGSSRTLVCGGSRAFVQRLCNVVSSKGITVIHMSLPVLAAIKEMDDDIHCCHGSLENFSTSDVQFDAVFLQSTVTAAYSLENLFRSVVSLCNPGARIVFSSVHGREMLMIQGLENLNFHTQELPPEALLQKLIRSMPIRILKIHDTPHIYLAALKQRFPMRARSHVVRGMGRGSSKMGIPTANLDPPKLSEEIRGLSKGVYFGYARRCGSDSNAGVYKMVMNKGTRPTFGDNDDVTVEIHVLHKFDTDFYGKEMSIILLGFIREEMKFNSMEDLLVRIRTDIRITEKILDKDEMSAYAGDPSLFKGTGEI